jgi:copper chaperone CopZ
MAQELTERAVYSSSKISGDRDVERLEDELSSLDGVRDVEVDTNAHTVAVVFDPTVVSKTAVQSRVERLGYVGDPGDSAGGGDGQTDQGGSRDVGGLQHVADMADIGDLDRTSS